MMSAITPSDMAQMAARQVKALQAGTTLSLIEMATVFRMAAHVCDESQAMHQRAELVNKINKWKPGDGLPGG